MEHAQPKQASIPFPNGIRTLFDSQEWRMIPAAHRGSGAAWRARTALADVFDDTWLREQTWTSHPFAWEWMQRYGRWKILRLGTALHVLRASAGVRERLRHPEHFTACAEELDFGLSLRLSGAQVQHEPLTPLAGPDFLATWGPTGIAFEVKCPKTSVRMKALEHVATQVCSGLSEAIGGASHLPGYFLEVEVVGTRLARAAESGSDQSDLVQLVKAGATTWLQAPRPGTIPLSGDVRFQATRREGRGIQPLGPCYGGDELYERRRLVRNALAEAAEQLAKTKMPGLVVFSKERDSLLGNHLRGLAELVRQDSMFASVTGLVEYDVEPDAKLSRTIATARILTRSEAKDLAPILSRLDRAARVSLTFF